MSHVTCESQPYCLLPHTAAQCNTLQHTRISAIWPATRHTGKTLTATHCNTREFQPYCLLPDTPADHSLLAHSSSKPRIACSDGTHSKSSRWARVAHVICKHAHTYMHLHTYTSIHPTCAPLEYTPRLKPLTRR